MRYVNLNKRNTSKFQFVSKRLATISFACFALTAVIVVPLTSRVNEFAKVNGLKTTIGSDFHTIDNIHPIIGLVGEDIDINYHEVIKFPAKTKRKKL